MVKTGEKVALKIIQIDPGELHMYIMRAKYVLYKYKLLTTYSNFAV